MAHQNTTSLYGSFLVAVLFGYIAYHIEADSSEMLFIKWLLMLIAALHGRKKDIAVYENAPPNPVQALTCNSPWS